MLLLPRLLRHINVYSGIPPSLLASISMGSSITATSQPQLLKSLQKHGLASSPPVLSALSLDRKLFTTDPNCYNNKPSPISEGENMTDAVTHAITLQALWNHVEDLKGRKGLEVLDVGCGHGYLTLAMARLFEGSRVTGVDIHGRAVDVAKGIWEGNFKELNVEFVCEDVDKDGAKVLSKDYDIIHCGFFVKQSLHQKLLKSLKPLSLGLWPIAENNQQRLYVFKKDHQTLKRQYLITTLFTEQRHQLNPETKKYFVQYDNSNSQTPLQHSQPIPRIHPTQTTKQKGEAVKQATQQFKMWQEQFKKDNGRPPKLEEIRGDPIAKQLLERIKGKQK